VSTDRLIQRTAVAVFLLVLAGVAFGQTQPWDTNIVSWNAPTTCQSGQPVANCPVTGYRVERSSTSGGAFATVGSTTSALTFTHNGAAAGQNCYRVIALSATGDSGPSNVACKTNTQPAGPPSPPTNLRFTDTVAFDLRRIDGRQYLSRHVANVKPAAVPYRRYSVANGSGYCQVLRTDVSHVKPSSGVLVAKCA
jgi:hypothetical protein